MFSRNRFGIVAWPWLVTATIYCSELCRDPVLLVVNQHTLSVSGNVG